MFNSCCHLFSYSYNFGTNYDQREGIASAGIEPEVYEGTASRTQ